tara:strand:+ start:2064 stop:2558 length:495 start_codon:yes stop_codon:yes gene_type:complete
MTHKPSIAKQIRINETLNPLKRELQNMINVESIFDRTRRRSFVVARQFFYKYAKSKYGLTYDELGWYSGRDHASVLHSIKTFDNEVSYNKDLLSKYNGISAQLEGILRAEDLSQETVRDFVITYCQDQPFSVVEKIYEHIVMQHPSLYDNFDFKIEHNYTQTTT